MIAPRSLHTITIPSQFTRTTREIAIAPDLRLLHNMYVIRHNQKSFNGLGRVATHVYNLILFLQYIVNSHRSICEFPAI